MNKKNFKSLVQEIKKMASPPPPPPGSVPDGPARPPIPVPGGGGGSGSGIQGSRSPEIKEMQKAMQSLSSILNGNPKLIAFMNDHYGAKINLDILKMGQDKKRPFINGVWDQSVNNNVNNIANLAAAFIRLPEDFGKSAVNVKSFDKNDYDTFKDAIPTDEEFKSKKYSAQEFKASAADLTKLIAYLGRSYQVYSSYVEQDETFKKLTDKGTALLKITPDGKELGDQATQYIASSDYLLSNKLYDIILPNINGGRVSVSPFLIQLSSSDQFKRFVMYSLGFDATSFIKNQRPKTVGFLYGFLSCSAPLLRKRLILIDFHCVACFLHFAPPNEKRVAAPLPSPWPMAGQFGELGRWWTECRRVGLPRRRLPQQWLPATSSATGC